MSTVHSSLLEDEHLDRIMSCDVLEQVAAELE